MMESGANSWIPQMGIQWSIIVSMVMISNNFGVIWSSGVIRSELGNITNKSLMSKWFGITLHVEFGCCRISLHYGWVVIIVMINDVCGLWINGVYGWFMNAWFCCVPVLCYWLWYVLLPLLCFTSLTIWAYSHPFMFLVAFVLLWGTDDQMHK